ncbi:MAG TPA: SigE family RNA polymerase sigma factor [Candidatus Limnocylindrales bacterium]|nr:SigE family RNA polymerase sigma factor [Candidatus Limnocylindrales bacterium]
MADSGQFDEFVAARSHRLLQLGFLLTRDYALAEDLLQTALVKCWTAWNRIDGDPEPYVRRTLINTYNSWWRRRWRGEHATATPPDQAVANPHEQVDDRDQVWRALARLPRQQRAVLALRYFEDLSESQIAELMSITPGAVRSYATKGLARLRSDPTLRTLPMPSPLEVPAGNERVVAVRRRISQARHRRTAVAVVGAALLVLLFGLLLVNPLRKPPPVTPSPTPTAFPSYFQGHRIAFTQRLGFDEVDTGFTFTPSTLELRVWLACTHPDPEVMVRVLIEINGQPYISGLCTSKTNLDSHVSSDVNAGTIEKAGLRVGVPATVRIRVNDPYTAIPSPRPSGPYWTPGGSIPAHGTVIVAIGEKVPFEQYPLPPRPRELVPLGRDRIEVLEGSTRIRSGAPVVVTWSGDMRVVVRSQTPGEFVIKVNGKPLWSAAAWDYSQSESMYDFPARPELAPLGSQATITVEARYTTGDWVVTIGPAPARP